MNDWITLRGDALNPLGTELSSIMDAGGRDR